MLSEWAGLLTALAAFGGMLWNGARTRADIRHMRASTSEQVGKVTQHLSPNHGSSLADAIRRTESLATEAVKGVKEVKEDQAQIRVDLNGLRGEVSADREAARSGQLQLTDACAQIGALRLSFSEHLRLLPRRSSE